MITDWVGEKILYRLLKLEKQISCLSFNLGITVNRSIGDGVTTNFIVSTGNSPFLVSTDGRNNDPLTEYTYNSGKIIFISPPSLDSIILILSQ